MDLKAARIVLRPRKVSEIFDLALRFCFEADRRLYLRLVLALVLPAWALCVGLRLGLGLGVGWTWFLAYGLSLLLHGPFTIAAGRLMFERELTVRDVFRHLRERAGPFLGATALRLLLLGVAPRRLLYVNEAALLERARGGEALGRSNRFVRGYGSHAVSIVLAQAVVLTAMILSFETLGQSITSFVLQLGEPFGTLWDTYVSPFALLGCFLAVPYMATARFLAYIDQRTRQDGWDIQVKFMAVQAAEADDARGVAGALSAQSARTRGPGGRAA